jgi:hypothetical protein
MSISGLREARDQIGELAKKHRLCSHYISGGKLIGLNGDFCHIQTKDDVGELKALMTWLRQAGLES